MQQLLNILNGFQPITLEEMDRVKLMNRTDTKFAFTYEQLEHILTGINSY